MRDRRHEDFAPGGKVESTEEKIEAGPHGEAGEGVFGRRYPTRSTAAASRSRSSRRAHARPAKARSRNRTSMRCRGYTSRRSLGRSGPLLFVPSARRSGKPAATASAAARQSLTISRSTRASAVARRSGPRGMSSSPIGSPKTTAHARRFRNDQRNVSRPHGTTETPPSSAIVTAPAFIGPGWPVLCLVPSGWTPTT